MRRKEINLTGRKSIPSMLATGGIILVIVAILAIAGCGGGSGSSGGADTSNQGTNAVSMESGAFNPSTLTVARGATVTWTNKENAVHTVTSGTRTSPSGLFDSGDLQQNGTFSFKFDTAGTFQYFCKNHTGMDATITVTQ